MLFLVVDTDDGSGEPAVYPGLLVWPAGQVRPEGGVVPANSDKTNHLVLKDGLCFKHHVDKQIKLHLLVPTCAFGHFRVI